MKGLLPNVLEQPLFPFNKREMIRAPFGKRQIGTPVFWGKQIKTILI